MTVKFDRSKLIMNLASGNILAPFLEKALSEFDEAWEFKYKPKVGDTAWHPSGDCMPDVMVLYEKAMGLYEESPRSGSLLKSFMVGHFWHQWIQHVVLHKLKFCEANAIERVIEKSWSADPLQDFHKPYHWARGQGDFAPLVTPKWEGVVDIKTMSSNQFKVGKVPDWAADKYKCQINIYMDLFEQEKGMIFAVNKDAPHDFKEFAYERDQALIDAIYRKWKYVSDCIDSDTIPTEADEDEYRLPL